MGTVRKRNLKVFTLAFVLITVTSFLLNYKHQVTTNTWDPKHIITQFSEHVRKLIKYPRRPCSCNTCISEPGHSLWFDQRFNSTMQPFLTSQNALIPEDSYRWWLVSGRRACVCGPGCSLVSAQRVWCGASNDAEQIAKIARGCSCQKRVQFQLTRQSEVGQSGCFCCCLGCRHSSHTFVSSKLEKSPSELGICTSPHCFLLPSRTRIRNVDYCASGG